MQLSEKIILITGASDGIGKATALECGKEGATVIIHGRSQPKLEALYDEMVGNGHPEPVIYPLDLEKMTDEDCHTMHDAIKDQFGRLDGLFNNAGWLGASSPVQHYDLQLWHRVMQINLNACFMLTQACLPLLNNEHRSTILFNLDDKVSAYWGAYGVSKAGLAAFMEILADELELTSINVTGLMPDTVRTTLRTRAFPGEDPRNLYPPEDVAKAAAFLLNENSRVINDEISHGRIFSPDELLAIIDQEG
jgi:NAD(P)-dependent dehydrogenase (short-subunit alcohol dehydrogenase family)